MRAVSLGLERLGQTETWNVTFHRAVFVYVGKQKGVSWKHVPVRVGMERGAAERFITGLGHGLGMVPAMFDFTYHLDAL